MWPVLLNMTRDECRRTLRRLELEAYSNMISVFRAQGALEENRKKLLEELRAVLRISHDRHSAEARRVSNDELLATIAEQIAGPNTGLAWISEGRRIIPLMPRGIAQTMYTEIADKVAEVAVAENKEVKNKIEAEKLVAPVSNEEEIPDPETAESALECSESLEDMYPPVATEDHSSKIWETELICRKRKIPEGGTFEDTTTPVKNMRNIPVNAHQKHVNLSQVYSKYSQPTISKQSSQSKHSYNQVSKVSTSKSSQTRAPRQQHKHRTHKPRTPRAHKKQQKDAQMSPGNQFNPVSMQIEYSGPPSTFQASYAQSILANKNKPDFIDEFKPKMKSSPGMVSDSPTMHLLTQPATVPHELGLSENAHPDDPKSLQAQSTPIAKQAVTGKPSQVLIRNKDAEKKIPVPEFKIVQKPNDNFKILTNRQIVVSPSSTQKALNTGKVVTTKVIGSIPKIRTPTAPVKTISDRMVVVSKTPVDTRISHPKFIITSSSTTTSIKNSTPVSSNNFSTSTSETLTPKGIPATDLKVSAKTFVLNPKSGKTMVVVPAKTNKEVQGPLYHFKGIPTAMKLVSVSSQPNTPISKFNPGLSTPKPTIVSAVASNPKILGIEPIKTANLADIVPVKGLTPVTTQKITSPIIRPLNTKGNLIVVQKGATLGKTLTFTKNGNDMSKIIMGKNVNQLLQAKTEQGEPSKSSNVIVLELNNEQSAKTTTMSEILDSRVTNPPPLEENKQTNQVITQDTPVLFDTQVHGQPSPNSLDSSTSLNIMEKSEVKSSFSKGTEIKDSPSITDWDMELESVPTRKKNEDDKLNSVHLDLGMSSESESEYIADGKSKSEHSSQDSIQQDTQRGMTGAIYSGASGLALATRTLLSQLQDEGSSSNDSSFSLKSKKADTQSHVKIDKSESDALSKAKAKLTQKVAEAQSQQKRIDVYSTAISTSDINLDSFSYLDESLMAGDDEFGHEPKREGRRDMLDEQLSRLLADDSANSSDSQTVSERLPLTSEQ